jgi:two-component system sensor histidine kinase DegS
MSDGMPDRTDDTVRQGTAGSADSSAYTRSPMEGVGVTPAMPATDHPDGDTRMAMALLGAHEEERSRLAEELHDGPAQALANAIFQTEIVDRAVRSDPAAARAEILALRQMLERELDALRGYINQLRPSLGEAAGLDDALRDSANAMSQRTGMPVDMRLEGPNDELHESARTVVLRVAQEALRNIAKHSGATRAWVRTYATEPITGDDGDTPGGATRQWVLEVGDDGRGFDFAEVAAHPNRRHFGLRFMRERAELLGSNLTFQTGPAAGTVVRLTIDPTEERK